MGQNKGSILFISSVDPINGPGQIALNHIEAFRENGYEVDFLTKYRVEGRPDINYILKRKIKISNFLFKVWRKLFKINTTGHHLFYKNEKYPPVRINKILKKIRHDYDILIIYFWQDLLSYRTVEAIYDRMSKKPKVVFLCADYSVMTGGCHFMLDCTNYKKGCGNCPMLGKYANDNDFTAKNVEYRIRVNEKIRPVVISNTYMQTFLRQSPVMKSGARLAYGSMILDLNFYKEMNQKECRKSLGISDNKFVILFGCQNFHEERKGMRYLIDALSALFEKISEEERENVMLISIGHSSKSLEKLLMFKHKHFGYVHSCELPQFYSAANVFVSPSIDDAGPSMVNQSIACGTPVVSFDIGTASEVIKDSGAGYCVPLRDSISLAESIFKIIHQSETERLSMRKKSRDIAVKYHSYNSIVKSFEDAISAS